ncbi:MAG: HEAT repeat domain-containing protein [Betaproteobacteria bacterium]|nr:HEAT repeat domain-containing protein [Betaproteobacteria bacterium]NBS47629.1 HEAT repeat domain-containing protein [Betaproteobacteria bacterium]
MGLKRAEAPGTGAVADLPAPGEADQAIDWVEALQSGDTALRRTAAATLAGRAAACPLLCAQLETETDPSVRTALFNSVVMIGGPDAAEGLMPLLRSEDPQLRNAAIEAMAEMPDAVAPCIERLLDDEDPDVRIFTVNILGMLRHPRVQDWLMQVLAHDPDVNTVATAIDALAEAGDSDALPALAIAAQRFAGNPFIEFAASVARERIEAP